jgi:Cdc6-like AAA superfamily ATPase
MNQFSDLLKIEEEFLLKQIELDKGIGKNELLKENLFLLFLAVITKIPVIIVGKPGTGKSLSAQLIYNSMKGEYSKNEFFKKYPPIIQIYFQGSKSTIPDDVTELFKKAEGLYESFKKIKKKNDVVPIYMIFI